MTQTQLPATGWAMGQERTGRVQTNRPPPGVSFNTERLQQIGTLRDVIWQSIETKDPYVDSRPKNTLFHSNYDWHSSVHAHWAALSMARVTGDTALENKVMARITPKALEAERDYLKKNPNFEVPYGQAWLTMMATELKKHPGGDTPELRKLEGESRERVLKWLETEPCPGEPGVRVNAAHDSWLFAFALMKQSRPDDPRSIQRLTELQKRVDAARPNIERYQGSDYDFLDLPGVMAFIDASPPIVTQRGSFPAGRAGDLPGTITDSNEHQAGKTAMRLWPYAQDAAKGDAAASEQVDGRMREMMARPELYQADFKHVAHWVPQFMWMAMWQQKGAP